MTSNEPGRSLVATSAAALVAAACRDPRKGALVEPAPPFERSLRTTGSMKLPGTGVSLTPLQDMHEVITPSWLHFESHHAGVPAIDLDVHELLVHGLTERALVLRLPEISSGRGGGI